MAILHFLTGRSLLKKPVKISSCISCNQDHQLRGFTRYQTGVDGLLRLRTSSSAWMSCGFNTKAVEHYVYWLPGMLKISRILFPVDFSAQAYAAAPFADAMASRFDAQLIVLTVVPIPAFPWFQQSGEPPLIDAESLKNDLEPRLDGAFRKEFANLEVERVMELGEPAEVIARFAETQGVDLIMMPTHGSGPPRRLLLGSVTAKVLHDTQCPVWTRVHTGEPEPVQERAQQTVLCAVGRSTESTPVMQWAGEFAEQAGAVLRFVHVIPDFDDWSPSPTQLAVVREDICRTIESLQRQAGVRAPSSVVIGKIGPGLREQAKHHRADFVIIGRGRLQDTPGRLGKQAYDIIRHAPCPVISM